SSCLRDLRVDWKLLCGLLTRHLVHGAGEEEGDLLDSSRQQASLGGEGADRLGQSAVGGGAPAAGGGVPVSGAEALPIGLLDEGRVPEAIQHRGGDQVPREGGGIRVCLPAGDA